MNDGIRKLLFIMVLAGISFAAFALMIKPANKDIAEQKKRVQDKRAKLILLEEARKRIDSLDLQVTNLEEAVAYFETKLPNKNEIHEVLKQVTLVANKNGLQSKDVETLKSTYKNGYIQQPIKLALKGDFLSLYRFVVRLEKLERITKISEIDIKTKDNFGDVEAIMIINVYYQDKVQVSVQDGNNAVIS